jgi:hypothetical protein
MIRVEQEDNIYQNTFKNLPDFRKVFLFLNNENLAENSSIRVQISNYYLKIYISNEYRTVLSFIFTG